jgi:hypothetical protein
VGCVGVWGHSLRSTFHRLHLLRLWTPTILYRCTTNSRLKDALDGAGMNKRELEKNKQKVQDLCSAMKAKGHATNLSIEHISADHLSMETLLSLTSKRAGEWFKEELRELGGLDHLVRSIFLAASSTGSIN